MFSNNVVLVYKAFYENMFLWWRKDAVTWKHEILAETEAFVCIYTTYMLWFWTSMEILIVYESIFTLWLLQHFLTDTGDLCRQLSLILSICDLYRYTMTVIIPVLFIVLMHLWLVYNVILLCDNYWSLMYL